MRRVAGYLSIVLTDLLAPLRAFHILATKTTAQRNYVVINVLSILIILFLPYGLKAQADTDKELFEKAKSQLYSDPDETIRIAKEFVSGSESGNDDSRLARGSYLLGVANLVKGRFFMAAEYFRNAISTEYAKDNISFEEACWNNLGIALDQQKKPEEAIQAYIRSLELNREMNDSTSVMQTLMNIGLLDIKSGNPEKALQRFSECLKFFEAENDTLNQGLCHQNIGSYFRDKKDFQTSNFHYNKAVYFFKLSNYPKGKIESLVNVAYNEFEVGNLESAFVAINKASVLNEPFGNPVNEADINALTGKIYVRKYQYKTAEEFLKKALAKYHESKFESEGKSLSLDLLRLYAITGNMQSFDNLYNVLIDRSTEKELEARMNLYNEFSEFFEHSKHLEKIQEQETELKYKSRQVALLIVILTITLLTTLIILFLYLKIRWFERFIFRKNLIQIQDTQKTEPVSPNNEDQKIFDLYNKIIDLMENKKIYTENDLSLAGLAMELNTNEKYISMAINQYSQYNFTGLVNNYRINEACKMLLKKEKKYRITEVYKYSGYSEPSTFYRNFKEITGLTPRQFVKLNDELPGSSLNVDNHN